MTEASHQMSSNPLPKYGSRKIGTVGKGTNVQVRIRDPDSGKWIDEHNVRGEVCIQGLNVTRGYHNNQKANQENFTSDGWFRTGDQGFLDEDNFLTLTGRLKELINRGGEKISPIELDSILLEMPGVAEAVVFPAPNEKYGEEVCCAIVPKDLPAASSVITPEAVKRYCISRLAAFKVPARVFICDSLPKTATGKIQRRFIAAHFLEQEKAGS